MRARQALFVAAFLIPLLGAGGRSAAAEQLASVLYTARDGLAGDYVQSIFQDSRGFLWVATASGVSCFDGRRFITYTTQDGLPHPEATGVIETPDGTAWVGTAHGLGRLRPRRGPAGTLFDALGFGPSTLDNIVRSMVLDKGGHLLVAAGGPLWRIRVKPGGAPRPEKVGLDVNWPASDCAVEGVAWAPDGSLWVAAAAGLVRVLPDQRQIAYRLSKGPRAPGVSAIAADRAGRIWLAGPGVLAFVPEPADEAAGFTLLPRARKMRSAARPELPDRPGEVAELEVGAGPAGPRVASILAARDGSVWIATDAGLLVVGGGALRRYGTDTGWPTDRFTSAFEDRDGNVWVGTEGHGLIKVLRSGFSWYGVADGLPATHVAGFSQDTLGRIVAAGYPPGNGLFVMERDRFVRVRVPVPPTAYAGAWGWNDAVVRDHEGDWWFPTDAGIYRFAAPSRLEQISTARPRNLYDREHGLGADQVFRLFEDSHGDVWVGLFGHTRMACWHRARNTFQTWGPDDPAVPFDTPTAFAEDRGGDLWVGFYRGGLVRFRHGDARPFVAGPPAGFVNDLLVDHRGRLWVGTTMGLGRCDDPTADAPAWRRYSQATGLASDAVNAVVEDRFGRIYVGGYQGLDRLSPDDGTVEHFDTTSGLLNNVVLAAYADADGDIWLATTAGVGRYHPAPGQPPSPPQTLIYSVRVDGVPVDLPELGLSWLDLGGLHRPGAGMDVNFGAVNFLPGRRTSFYYTLARGESWSEPLSEPSLHLAGLAAGTYLLRVFARVGGAPAGVPATLRFVVPRPFWQSWWFAAAIGLAILGSGYGLFQSRMRRLLAVQDTRRRIARDLHDELGLSLSRISILSEVVARRVADSGPRRELAEIGATARELIDATADMVWALDSRHDDLESLMARLRRLAGDVLDESGLQWRFSAPSRDGVRLSAERRRHLYLVLKEAINNAARHSHGTTVTVAIEVEGGSLRATVSDNGRGMPEGEAGRPEDSQTGHGLPNMVRRVRELGGVLSVQSRPGAGTTIAVTLPLAGHRRWGAWGTANPPAGTVAP